MAGELDAPKRLATARIEIVHREFPGADHDVIAGNSAPVIGEALHEMGTFLRAHLAQRA